MIEAFLNVMVGASAVFAVVLLFIVIDLSAAEVDETAVELIVASLFIVPALWALGYVLRGVGGF